VFNRGADESRPMNRITGVAVRVGGAAMKIAQQLWQCGAAMTFR
jgi:hypothetical protein